MSSRTRGPRNRASKLPVADKPQFGQKKKKPQGSKVRKLKYSSAGPSHGTKVEEPKIATSPPHQGAVTSSCFFSADGDPSAAGSKVVEQKIARARLLQEWSKGACYFYNPRELRGAPGAKVEEPKIHPCPHQGSDNIFDFIFCKPDCPRSVSDSVFPGRSSALPNIKDDSSSSDPVLSGDSLALVNIKDDSSSSDSVLSDRSLLLSNSEDDSSSSESDGGMIPRPYAPRPRWDSTQCTQHYICSSVQFLPWRPWEVITGGLDSKLVMWDFSKGSPNKIVNVGLPNVNNGGEQCLNPSFVHAIAVPEIDMLDKSDKVCVVARGDGAVDVINIEAELDYVRSKGSVKPRKGSQSKSKDTDLETPDQNGRKRLHLDYSSGGHTAAVSCVGRFIISGGNDKLVKVCDWTRYSPSYASILHQEQTSSSDLLHLNINLSKKVNWLCTTPADTENLVVCDTTKVVKVYSIA